MPILNMPIPWPLTLWEYDPDNHTENSKHSETTLESFLKDYHTIIFQPHWHLLALIITLKLTEKLSALSISFVLPILSITLGLFCFFQCNFQCHILIVLEVQYKLTIQFQMRTNFIYGALKKLWFWLQLLTKLTL